MYHEIQDKSNLSAIVDGIVYTEAWVDVNEWEGVYQISSFGRLRSVQRTIIRNTGKLHKVSSRLLKGTRDKDGYRTTSFWKENKEYPQKIHRLVGASFIDNPENKPFINHKNGAKDYNPVWNLEWATEAENSKHAYNVLGIKVHSIGKTGILSATSKKIACTTYDICFDSIKEAADALGVNRLKIIDVCKKRLTHINGMNFRYLNCAH